MGETIFFQNIAITWNFWVKHRVLLLYRFGTLFLGGVILCKILLFMSRLRITSVFFAMRIELVTCLHIDSVVRSQLRTLNHVTMLEARE